jgi:hypothetical protein
MPYLIGTDEAGYGPNLGPLVISASVWEVPEGVGAEDLYGLLGGVVRAEPPFDSNQCVPIADSKVLYRPGHGLRHLERGVAAALALLGRQPATWRAAFECLDSASALARRAMPWYANFDCPLPLDSDPAETGALAVRLAAALAAAGVRLVDLRSRVVFEDQFNRLLECH